MSTPVNVDDYYGPIEQIIKNYIGVNRGDYTDATEKEITIGNLDTYYNQHYRPSREKSQSDKSMPLIIPSRTPPAPADFKIKPFKYFVDFINTNIYRIFGKYESSSNNITITYKKNGNADNKDIKESFKAFINEKINTIELINNISKFEDQSAITTQQKIIDSSHMDNKSKAEKYYALGFAQNKINNIKLTHTTFEDYLKKYEFHNRSDLKNLLIYTVLDDNDKVIDIKNLIATMKANVGEEVYQKIFIEILEEVDRADKENKAKNEEEDITNVIETVVLQRYPADQSVVNAIQNNIDTYAIIKIIKAKSLETGEISQAKLIEMFATASGVDERQKANGRYFIAFLRKNGYTVKKVSEEIKFFKGPATGNADATGDGVVPGEFTKYRERYEFHSKEEIVPLVYLAITDIDGEIFPDIQARIQKIEKDLSINTEPESRSRISKFIDVLKEFKRYVDKNGVTFTNQNMANTLPMIEDFVNNLYPNYGPQQAIDNIPFYSAPSDFKKDEALESVVTSISPMRGPYALEVDKDRYAYEKLRAEARKIDANRELKRRKLEDVARDLAGLAGLVPDNASQEYVMDTYANSALHQGMLKIVKKLTPEQKEQKKEETKQRETEQKQRTDIEERERARELANVKRTAQEAENALKMAEKLGNEPEKAEETKGGKQQGGVIPEGERDQEQGQEQRDPTQYEPMNETREVEETRDEMAVETKKEEDDEKKDEEDEEEEEKDQGEMNEDVKRIKNYKKSKEKLDKIKADIVNTENAVVRFKPYMDRYTIESPLTALDTANKDYEQIKLKINEIQKKKQEKIGIFEKNKDSLDSSYREFRVIKKDIIKINTDLISNKITEFKNINNVDIKNKINEIKVRLATDIEETKKNIRDYMGSDEIDKLILQIITDKVNNLSKSIYGDVKDNDEFINSLREIYESQNSRNDTDKITDSSFRIIIEKIPSYKELKKQESDINYEIEAKKNQASVVKTELQTAIDPVEMQDQSGLLEEAKKTTSENITQIKKIIENTHIPKFKSMWKVSLKEITEGPSSIENLLQRLVDRTLKATKDIQTRLASIHGISSAPMEGTTSDAEYRGERENRDHRLNRELDRYGGDGESNDTKDTSDPQTIYRVLTEKLVKLKDLVEQLMSFLERNTNTTSLLSTNNEPSIFVQLYNKYVEDRADPKKSVIEATEGLTTSAKVNRVAPSDVLKIDKFDKTVFVGLTLFLRLFSITIMDYLIDKKWVFTIEAAFLTYLVAYTAIFVLFVFIVNIDMYRTRIIFNYINIHGGSMTIVGHVVMLWLFAMLLFIILRNIRFLNNPSGGSYQKAMTAEERSNLKNRMSILTAAVWIFTTIMVVVS